MSRVALPDRLWNCSPHLRQTSRRSSVRVAAFNDARRPKAVDAPPQSPSTNVAAPAKPAAQTTASRAVPLVPLTPDVIATLPPADAAASLLHYASTHARAHACGPHSGAVTTTTSATTVSSSGKAASGSIADVANTSPALNIPTGADPRVFAAVAARVREHADDFDGPSLVDVMQAFSQSGQGRGHRDALAVCCAALSGKVDELPPAALPRLAAACSALGLHPPDLLAALCARAGEAEVLTQFTPAELVELLASLAALHHRSPPLFADAADALAAELGAAAAAATSRGSMVAAPGSGGGSGGGGGGGAEEGQRLGPAQAVLAVWAMAASDAYHRPLFDAVGSLLMDRLGELDGNGLAKAAWSYATIRSHDESHRALRDRDLFDGIASVGLRRGVSSLPPRALVTLLWSFASVPHYDAPLFDAVADALAPHLFPHPAASPSSTSSSPSPSSAAASSSAATSTSACGSGSAVAAPSATATTAAAAPSPPPLAADLRPSDLVAVAWSVMRVGHKHAGLMNALGDAALACCLGPGGAAGGGDGDRDGGGGGGGGTLAGRQGESALGGRAGVDGGPPAALDGEDLMTIALAFPAAKAYNEAFFKYLVSEAQARPRLFGHLALLDIIRLVSRVQHRDPGYYGPALQVLLEHVHQAFLDSPAEPEKPEGCMNHFRFG